LQNSYLQFSEFKASVVLTNNNVFYPPSLNNTEEKNLVTQSLPLSKSTFMKRSNILVLPTHLEQAAHCIKHEY